MKTPGESAVAARTPIVAALDMGYGHLRAASAIARAAGTSIVEADRPPVANEREMSVWRRSRRFYEGLSRIADAWYAPGARSLLDVITRIPPPDPTLDLSHPNLAARSLDRFIRDGLGAGLAARLRETGDPLVATFYAQAIAADAHGARGVHLVVTDSDVNRVWVPLDPRRSSITYLVPTDATAARIRSYGMPPERVRTTGFPLPAELTDAPRLAADVAARIVRLDPRGTFRAAHAPELRERLGRVPEGPAAPVTIVFAVGGAGAQVGVAKRLLSSLREPMKRGEVRLVLVAGRRRAIAERFERWIAAADARGAAEVLFEESFPAYYARFNAAIAAADILWTKPSELTFYGALGLPLFLATPLGVHERRNRDWAIGRGAAIDARDAAATAARLPALLADGSLAATAWAGFTRMPRDGTRRILESIAVA